MHYQLLDLYNFHTTVGYKFYSSSHRQEIFLTLTMSLETIKENTKSLIEQGA